MKGAAGALAAAAVFLTGVLTGFAQQDGGGPAPGLVELGDTSATTPTSTPTTATTIAVSAPATTTTTTAAVPGTAAAASTTPPASAPDHEGVEHDVDEHHLDGFDEHHLDDFDDPRDDDSRDDGE